MKSKVIEYKKKYSNFNRGNTRKADDMYHNVK